MSYLKTGLGWVVSWALFWSITALVGGMVGALAYSLVAPFVVPDWSWSRRLAKGFVNGFFYLGVVWGPGLAIVLCFVRGHRRNRARRAAAEENESAGERA
ncbi:MAG: hypothetical protein ACFE0O_08100 [Opitutales bacterium]